MDKRFKGTEEEYKEFRRNRNIANKKYYSKPEIKAKKKIYKKKHDIENKEKISLYGKNHYAIPEVKERVKKWREDNKEYLSIKGKEWRRINKERKKINDKKYNQKNKDKVNLYHLKWSKENPEIKKGYNQKYYTSPKGRLNSRHHVQRRLALLKERPCDLSNAKVKEIFDRDKVCVYCGSNEKLELDHITPLKLGGNSLLNNFVLACKKCNTKKSAKDVCKWCEEQGIEIPKIVIKLLENQHQGI